MKRSAIFMSTLAIILCFSGCSVEVEDDDADKADKKTTKTIAVTSVAIDKSTISCYVGQPGINLVSTVSPSDASIKTVTWTSDSPTVAKVTTTNVVGTSIVYAVSPGEAIITATCGDKSAKCTVTVLKSSLDLNSGDRIVMQENIFQFKASITPADSDQTITWVSTDTSIATVNSGGYVTGIGPGEAYISATTQDGAKKAVKITVYPCKKLTETTSFISGNINTSPFTDECYYKFSAIKGTPYSVKIRDNKSFSSDFTCWVETSVYSDEQLPDNSRLTSFYHFNPSPGTYVLNSFTTSETQYVYIYIGSYDGKGGSYEIQITH